MPKKKKTVDLSMFPKIVPPALGVKRVGTKIAGKGLSLAMKELARHGKSLKRTAAKRTSASPSSRLKMARAGDKAIRRSRRRK